MSQVKGSAALPILLICLALLSCGEGRYSPRAQDDGAMAGPIAIQLQFPEGFRQYSNRLTRAAPWYVVDCTLTITGANLQEPLVLPVPLDTGLVSGELMVGMYKFEIFITTNDPGLNFYGTDTIPLIANITNKITFGLQVNAPPRIVSITVDDPAPVRSQVVYPSCSADDWDAQDTLTYWWTDNWGWRGEGASLGYFVAYPEPTWLTCHVTDGIDTASVTIFLDVLGLPKTIQNVAAAAGDTQATLTFTADPIADTYNIYWNTTGNVTIADNKVTGVTGAPFIHTGLVNAQMYYYRVSGENLSGEGPLSAEVKAFPAPPPTNLAVTPDFYFNTLSWTGSPGSTYYKIYWNLTGGVTNADAAISVTWGATIYSHAPLTGNQPYFYRVAGVNPGGETTLSVEAMGVPLPKVTATPVHNGVALTWDAVPGTTSYNVYWSNTGTVTTLDNPTPIPPGTMSFVHRALTPGATYYYAVEPVPVSATVGITAPSSALVGPKIGFTPIGLLPNGNLYHEATDIFDPGTSTIITIYGYAPSWTYQVALSTHNAGDTITNLPVNPANNTPELGYWARGAVWGGYAYFTNRTTTAYAPILGAGSLGSWTLTSNAGTPVGPSYWRTLHQTLAHNGRMYTLGGYTYESPSCLSDIRYTTINANGTLNPWTVNATSIPGCTYRHGATISPYGHMYFANGTMLQVAPVNAGSGAVGAFAPVTTLPPGYDASNFDNSHQGLIVNNGYLFVTSPWALFIMRVDTATGDTISWIDTIPLPYGCNTRTFYINGGNMYFAARGGTGSVFRIDGLAILASYP